MLAALVAPAVETTGAHAVQVRPVYAGVPVAVTDHVKASGESGMFDWLDDLGSTAGNIFNNAVETVGNNWIQGLDETNPGGVTVVDSQPVESDSKAPVSWVQDNRQALLIGGAVLLGVGALYLAGRR